jgi:POT family proton-dependent oligopeptide transporter
MQQQKQLFGHPIGLYVLFFTELWERFSFYGMRAILVLFMVAPATGVNSGLGWSETRSLKVYGIYSLLVYVSSIPGAIIADQWLGQKKTTLLGCLLLVVGHSILAVQAFWAFYTGLAFIISGVGCLKANVSTMVGGLYSKDDNRRDKGFSIFYIGINTGSFLAALVVGYVGEIYGWHYGFGLAGIGMAIGFVTFLWGQRYLKGIGEPVIKHADHTINLAHTKLTKIEKDRILVILLASLLIIIFWGAYEQAGGLMNLYAEHKTDRKIAFLNATVPASWFQSVTSFFIITLGIPVAAFWYNWKKSGKESSSLFKIGLGIIIMGCGFLFMVAASHQFKVNGSTGMYWLILAYLLHTIGELCASPVTLSYITKLAPLKYSSSMMGIFFAATGLGNYAASWIGVWSQKAGELEIFLGIALFCISVGLLVIALLKPLKRLAHGVEDVHLEKDIPLADTFRV